MKNPLFSWGEIEGGGGEENGGNRFPWISPFLFPYKLEGNEKKKRDLYMGPNTMKEKFFFFSSLPCGFFSPSSVSVFC